ncbi:site-specific DNA-methyltransferase [candidate division KSB1 bacterium]
MINSVEVVRGFKTAEARWARFGPYYAMFPVDFAFQVVERHSKLGDYIIDPFAGRCSSIYAGGVLGRHSLGIEINPVGWLYGKAKLRPADKTEVIERLNEIYSMRNLYCKAIYNLPKFFKYCYCDDVLKFLLSARRNLNWRIDSSDATLMSILLVYLHGKLGEGLSNQMQMTMSMGVNYSIKWWKENGLTQPPEINPLDFLVKRIEWRYAKGRPRVIDSYIIFGDSSVELHKIAEKSRHTGIKFSLLFTSPPYHSVTNYHSDQWLRLWLLGGEDHPKYIEKSNKGRFLSKQNYRNLLDNVFGICAPMMTEKSTIYVRTDAREFTMTTTLEILEKYFPKHKSQIKPMPLKRNTRTELYGHKTTRLGEIDLIFST